LADILKHDRSARRLEAEDNVVTRALGDVPAGPHGLTRVTFEVCNEQIGQLMDASAGLECRTDARVKLKFGEAGGDGFSPVGEPVARMNGARGEGECHAPVVPPGQSSSCAAFFYYATADENASQAPGYRL
jgi:hypothetical protein